MASEGDLKIMLILKGTVSLNHRKVESEGSLIVVDILHFFWVFLEFKMMPDEFHKNDGF